MALAEGVEGKLREGVMLFLALIPLQFKIFSEELNKLLWAKASQTLLPGNQLFPSLKWQAVEGIKCDHAFSISRKLKVWIGKQ